MVLHMRSGTAPLSLFRLSLHGFSAALDVQGSAVAVGVLLIGGVLDAKQIYRVPGMIPTGKPRLGCVEKGIFGPHEQKRKPNLLHPRRGFPANNNVSVPQKVPFWAFYGAFFVLKAQSRAQFGSLRPKLLFFRTPPITPVQHSAW
jgi:hypothetical protein